MRPRSSEYRNAPSAKSRFGFEVVGVLAPLWPPRGLPTPGACPSGPYGLLPWAGPCQFPSPSRVLDESREWVRLFSPLPYRCSGVEALPLFESGAIWILAPAWIGIGTGVYSGALDMSVSAESLRVVPRDDCFSSGMASVPP